MWDIRTEKELISNEKEATSLTRLFKMWRQRLLNWFYTIFVWDGLSFPQVELERLTMLNGFGFIAFNDKAKGGMITSAGGLSGVTAYHDIFTTVTFAVAGKDGIDISGSYEIGKNAAVLWNTSGQISVLSAVEKYASLLAHFDISIKLATVNQRLFDTMIVATEAEKESYKSWYDSMYKGKNAAIVDKNLMMDVDDVGKPINLFTPSPRIDVRSLIEGQNEVLRQFYRDIGIRFAKDKKGNMTDDEINDDATLLMFNVSDMLEQRKRFCDECNRIMERRGMDTRLSVKLSPVYDLYKGGEDNEDSGVSDRGDTGEGKETNQP